MKSMQQRKSVTYAFIDSQNLNLGVQKVGWKMDWRKFRSYLQTEHNVSKAYMFIGYMPEYEQMYEQLHEAGYLIVLKPTVGMNLTAEEKAKLATDEQRKSALTKGNIDAELVLYAMKEMPNYQQAIIVSGDGDFYCLAEYLTAKKRLKAIMTPNRQYSSLLKPYESRIIRLDQLKHQLQHRDFRRSSTRKT